uniref:GH12850p n=1 Tax=Drosophila melanogaster TaxID=7227 RepID=Q95T85_DROME
MTAAKLRSTLGFACAKGRPKSNGNLHKTLQLRLTVLEMFPLSFPCLWPLTEPEQQTEHQNIEQLGGQLKGIPEVSIN